MAHKIIELLISVMGFVGIDVYLRFRKHVLNGDFYKRKDRE